MTVMLPETGQLDQLSYEELVTFGQRVVSGGQWILGDLAARVETKWGQKRAERYAEDIGIPYGSLQVYRATARAFPKNLRNLSIPYAVYQSLAGQTDRHELLASRDWNSNEARELVKGNRQNVLPMVRASDQP